MAIKNIEYTGCTIIDIMQFRASVLLTRSIWYRSQHKTYTIQSSKLVINIKVNVTAQTGFMRMFSLSIGEQNCPTILFSLAPNPTSI